jgi:hypothetical protein
MKRKREETLRRTNSKNVNPNKTQEIENLMFRIFKENPRLLYQFQLQRINMSTLETIQRMGKIFRTVQALKKKINGRGSTKNNPIIIDIN